MPNRVTGVIHEKIRSGRIRIGVMCGERWYWRHSWQNYPLFWSLSKKTNGEAWGFGIGPILFWDGS